MSPVTHLNGGVVRVQEMVDGLPLLVPSLLCRERMVAVNGGEHWYAESSAHCAALVWDVKSNYWLVAAIFNKRFVARIVHKEEACSAVAR